MKEGVYNRKITTTPVSNQKKSFIIMVLVKESFVLLSTVLNNILNVNVPNGGKNMTICFSRENRSDSILMSHSNINNDQFEFIESIFYYWSLISQSYVVGLVSQINLYVPYSFQFSWDWLIWSDPYTVPPPHNFISVFDVGVLWSGIWWGCRAGGMVVMNNPFPSFNYNCYNWSYSFVIRLR